MQHQNTNLTTWTPEKISLDGNIYVAELAPEGKLWLLNDTTKEELELSARATYDLMVALYERAWKIYEATHSPKEVYLADYQADEFNTHYHILPSTGTTSEHELPPTQTLYANATELYLAYIFAVAEEWAKDAYGYNARVVRIVPTETTANTPGQIPDFLLKRTTWYYYDGEADQSWKCTIYPGSGWQSNIVDHLYVHRIGGDVLITGGSESAYGSAVPRYLLLPIDDEGEYDKDQLSEQD